MQAAVILAYLALTLGIGLWAARRVRSLRDYVLAGRSLPGWITLPTMFALWFGAETVLGGSAAMASGGLGGDVIVDPLGAGLCLVLYGVFFARKLYATGNLTISDFYRDRFGPGAGFAFSIVSAPTYLFWVGAQMVALGHILGALTGWPPQLGMLAGSCVVVLYTFRGGMWAISITELLEMAVIVTCLLLVAFQVGDAAGGWSAILAAAPEGHLDLLSGPRAEGFSPLSWLNFAALWMAVGLGSLPSQDVYERLNSARTPTTAVASSVAGGLLYILLAAIPLGLGLVAAQHLGPEVVEEAGEGLVLRLIDQTAPEGVRLAFYAALLSAVLSTASAALLAPSVLIGVNIVRPLRPEATDADLLRLTRRTVALFALASYGVGLLGDSIHHLVTLSSTTTLVTLVVPLAAGLYWSRATKVGAHAAVLAGMASYLGLFLASLATPEGPGDPDGYTLYGLDISLAAFTVSAAALVVGSLLPAKAQEAIAARAALALPARLRDPWDTPNMTP